jgi:CheY-like chemotaxis protein
MQLGVYPWFGSRKSSRFSAEREINMTTSPYQVMLIDDNDDHCMLIEDLLYSTGFARKVVRFADAESTLSLFQGTGKSGSAKKSHIPDFFFLDLALPGMNGLELLKQLKTNSFTQSVPVIIFTVSDDAAHIRTAYANGASGYLVKPLNHKDLRRKLMGLKTYWDTISESPAPGKSKQISRQPLSLSSTEHAIS